MTRMSLRDILPGLLALTLGACALPAARPAPYPPDAYAHRVASSHVVLYWNCVRPEPGILRVEGVAQNPWSSQEVRFLEVEVVGVNNQERTVSHAKGAAQDILIHTNQFSRATGEWVVAAGAALPSRPRKRNDRHISPVPLAGVVSGQSTHEVGTEPRGAIRNRAERSQAHGAFRPVRRRSYPRGFWLLLRRPERSHGTRRANPARRPRSPHE
jgi:hypothetical protein